jgi:small subunit ribosomal protein S8
MSDPIADMLTRIRNANTVRRDRVEVPGSKVKRALAQILKEEGFIRDFEWIGQGPQGLLRVYLKYGPNRERVISGLERVSRCGNRVYRGRRRLPRVLGGLGVAIVTTPQGLMTDQKAREKRVGGEVICNVW